MAYTQSEAETAADYAAALDDLTSTSRPQITALTDIARDCSHAAGVIGRTLVTHIQNAAPDRILPSLYLMDSIAKTVGGAYVAVFGASVVPLFTDTYVRADASTRQAMVRLLSTWQGVFSDQALHDMAVFVSQLERPAPPPPAPVMHAPPPPLAVDPNLAALLAAWPALAQQAGALQQLMASGALNTAVLQQLLASAPASAHAAPVYPTAPAYTTPVTQPPPLTRPPPPPPSSRNTYYNSTSHTSSSTSSSSNRPHDAIVRSLYGDIPHQCPQCALRFVDKEKLRDHLDKHWKQNRRTQAKKVFSRPWYLNAEEWGRTPSSEGTPKASTANSVFGAPAHADNTVAGAKPLAISGEEVDAGEVGPGAKCGVCGEQFDKYYHDERESWLFKGGIRHPSNPAMLVHVDCLGEAEAELLAKHRIAHAEPTSTVKRQRGGDS